MQCDAFQQGRCRSCNTLDIPYPAQLASKQRQAEALLAAFGPPHWLAPVASAEAGFRNKAKMVVSGTVAEPILGILDAHGQGIDLRDCPLYPAPLSASFPTLARFITLAGLTPYDVPARRGELKYLLLTLAEHSGELMLRFVLRSRESLARIRRHLPWLLAELPELRVVSVNLQPLHQAVLEGEEEILLGPQEALRMQLNGLPLYLRPGGFFQTHTTMAAALYRQARAWVNRIDPPALWDLYCGVGGFALHCSAPGRHVTGIEISAEAIASARRSRDELGLHGVDFHIQDATVPLPALPTPPLVIVNPPRRGLGAELSQRLNTSTARWLIYSSCNASSLSRDLERLDGFVLRQARLFDMFPHTRHYELACLLERRSDPAGSDLRAGTKLDDA